MALPEVTLQTLRTLARRFADQMFSDFVTDEELNTYLNLGLRELYDQFAVSHGQEYFLKTVEILLVPPKTLYELPDDLVAVKGVDWSSAAMPATSTTVIVGTDSTVTTYDVPMNEATDVTPLQPYTFEDRHEERAGHTDSRYRSRDVSCLPQFRVLASNKTVAIDTIPSEGLPGVTTSRVNLIRLSSETSGYLYVWYWPEVPQLVDDTDSFPLFHGFEEYPALVAAIMMLAKEESDTSALQQRLSRLGSRIEVMANSRDIGHGEQVQDVEGGSW